MKLKRQTITAIVLASVFVVLLAVYLFLIRPAVSDKPDNTVSTSLLEGEVAISDKAKNFYVFQPVLRTSMKSIEVNNEFGGYKVYRDSTGTFQLDGFAGLSFDDQLLSSLVVTTGTPIAMMRVADRAGEAELAEYGLDTPTASWTVTDTDGVRYTMYVGDALVTGGGYYAKYAGRDAVYILSNTLADTILKPVKAILKPLLIGGLTTTDYYNVDEFTVLHGEDIFVYIEDVPKAEMSNPSAEIEHRLLYPTPEGEDGYSYTLNDTVFYQLLYDMAATEPEGIEYFIPSDAELASVGLDTPAYAVVYTRGANEYCIFVSALQDDGYYYAISNMSGYSMVCKVRPVFFEWLEKGKFSWIMTNPFFVSILKVSRITINGTLDGGVDADFMLLHGSDSEGNAIMEVDERVSGMHINNPDTGNFKQLYLTLLNITNQQFASLSDEDKQALVSDESKLLLTMTYESTDGDVNEYKFYKYYEASSGHTSGGRVFVTVNGLGEFYTTNDRVEKVAADVKRLLAGLDVDGDGVN